MTSYKINDISESTKVTYHQPELQPNLIESPNQSIINKAINFFTNNPSPLLHLHFLPSHLRESIAILKTTQPNPSLIIQIKEFVETTANNYFKEANSSPLLPDRKPTNSYKNFTLLLQAAQILVPKLMGDWEVNRATEAENMLGIKKFTILEETLQAKYNFKNPIHLEMGPGNGNAMKSRIQNSRPAANTRQFTQIGYAREIFYTIDDILLNHIRKEYSNNEKIIQFIKYLSFFITRLFKKNWYETPNNTFSDWKPVKDFFDLNEIYNYLKNPTQIFNIFISKNWSFSASNEFEDEKEENIPESINLLFFEYQRRGISLLSEIFTDNFITYLNSSKTSRPDLNTEITSQLQNIIIGDFTDLSAHIPNSSVSLISGIKSVSHIPSDKLEAVYLQMINALEPGGVIIDNSHQESYTRFLRYHEILNAVENYNKINPKLKIRAEVIFNKNLPRAILIQKKHPSKSFLTTKEKQQIILKNSKIEPLRKVTENSYFNIINQVRRNLLTHNNIQFPPEIFKGNHPKILKAIRQEIILRATEIYSTSEIKTKSDKDLYSLINTYKSEIKNLNESDIKAITERVILQIAEIYYAYQHSHITPQTCAPKSDEIIVFRQAPNSNFSYRPAETTFKPTPPTSTPPSQQQNQISTLLNKIPNKSPIKLISFPETSTSLTLLDWIIKQKPPQNPFDTQHFTAEHIHEKHEPENYAPNKLHILANDDNLYRGYSFSQFLKNLTKSSLNPETTTTTLALGSNAMRILKSFIELKRLTSWRVTSSTLHLGPSTFQKIPKKGSKSYPKIFKPPLNSQQIFAYNATQHQNLISEPKEFHDGTTFEILAKDTHTQTPVIYTISHNDKPRIIGFTFDPFISSQPTELINSIICSNSSNTFNESTPIGQSYSTFISTNNLQTTPDHIANNLRQIPCPSHPNHTIELLENATKALLISMIQLTSSTPKRK